MVGKYSEYITHWRFLNNVVKLFSFTLVRILHMQIDTSLIHILQNFFSDGKVSLVAFISIALNTLEDFFTVPALVVRIKITLSSG